MALWHCELLLTKNAHFLSGAASFASDPVLVYLLQVKVLTLQKGRLTTGRRHAGVPQLQCLSGCYFEPGTVLGACCADTQNMAREGHRDVFHFGNNTVSCTSSRPPLLYERAVWTFQFLTPVPYLVARSCLHSWQRQSSASTWAPTAHPCSGSVTQTSLPTSDSARPPSIAR